MLIKRWLKFAIGPAFWIGAVQSVWTITLVFWIIFFVDRRNHGPEVGWGPLVVGIVLLGVMLVGSVVVLIHFGRQVAHNRAMKDFVSTVSHDLRSPLAAAKLHIDTLRLRNLNSHQKDTCLSMASQNLERLESGIENVLTASRIERRGLKFNAERVELKEELQQYANFKAKEVNLQGAQLFCNFQSHPLAIVLADRQLLRHILDNLVDNAIHHSQTGVQIHLDLVAQSRCAVIGVRDNGPGLKRQELKRVFRMFYRAPPARRHTKGTGLGLFIVAGVARAHGGHAWAELPENGCGCYFRVALPQCLEKPKKAKKARSPGC